MKKSSEKLINKKAQKSFVKSSDFSEINPNPMVEIDFSGKIYYINPAAKKLFPNLSSLKMKHPYLKDINSIRINFKKGKKKYFDREIKVNDLWFHQNFSFLKNIQRIQIFGFYISERKKVEEKLKESERILNKTQEIAHLGTWELKFGSNRPYWSDETYRMYGYKPGKFNLRNSDFINVIHPEDRKMVSNAYFDSIKKNKYNYSCMFRIIKKTGEIRTLYEKCEHIRDESGKIVRSIGMVQDVTERKYMERALEEAKRYLENLFDYANAPIAVWNPILNITKFNHAFEKMTGYKEKEVIGKRLEILFPPESKTEIFKKIKNITTGGCWEAVEIPIRQKDGKVKIVLWNSANIYGKDGKSLISTIAQGQDITERKNLDQRKDEFITIAGHELRTPISAIKITNQMLQDMLKDNPKALKYLNRIENQATIQANLINDLLNVSKIQTGKLEIRKENFDLQNLVEETAEDMQQITKEHKIIVKGKICGKIFADKERIGQILVNFCSNAIKFSPKGKKIIINLKNNQKEAIVGVTDYGIGIPKEHHDRIFDRFYRAYGTGDKQYPGLGMGLYISYQIIKLFDGNMWFKSTPGKGSTFYFSLPFQAQN